MSKYFSYAALEGKQWYLNGPSPIPKYGPFSKVIEGMEKDLERLNNEISALEEQREIVARIRSEVLEAFNQQCLDKFVDDEDKESGPCSACGALDSSHCDCILCELCLKDIDYCTCEKCNTCESKYADCDCVNKGDK